MTDEEFEKAVERYGELINDELVVRVYDARQDAIRNEKYRLKLARLEGIEEGKKEALEMVRKEKEKREEEEFKKNVLKEMIASDYSDDFICKVLSLTKEELIKLKEKIK